MESDGVLLTLAHLLLSTRDDPAIGVEEPETATYPSLIESRLALFRTLTQESDNKDLIQMLITTHSHVLLSAVQDPELVRIFERQPDGHSRIYQPPEQTMFEVIGRRLGWATGS
jgi:predicted ATPase